MTAAADLLHERYAGAFDTTAATLNDTLATIIGHRSCRRYLPQEVSREMLDLLIAAGQSAPSSCNLQSWSVIALTDPQAKARVRAISSDQAQVEEAPLLLCFVADLARLEQVAVDNGVPHEALDYLETLLVGVIDAALAAQNLAVAAESLGLGTCYIGSIRNNLPEMCRLLGLPKRVVPLFGMTIGYPDPAMPAAIKPRLAPSSVLHIGQYDSAAAVAPVPAYEQALEAFNQSQGRRMPLWGMRSATRISTVERMEGRHELGAQLKAQGLGLK